MTATDLARLVSSFLEKKQERVQFQRDGGGATIKYVSGLFGESQTMFPVSPFHGGNFAHLSSSFFLPFLLLSTVNPRAGQLPLSSSSFLTYLRTYVPLRPRREKEVGTGIHN